MWRIVSLYTLYTVILAKPEFHFQHVLMMQLEENFKKKEKGEDFVGFVDEVMED